MENPWKKLSSKTVHKNPWYSITNDKVRRPDGSTGNFFVMHKDPGVVIIPFNGKKVYLENMARYTFERRMWEFPAGKSESGKYREEAKRELKEETGLSAKKWKYLGEFACGPGHTSHMGKVFLAQNLTAGAFSREPGEVGMTVKSFSIKEVDTMIESRIIIDSWTITAWYYFKEYLDKRK